MISSFTAPGTEIVSLRTGHGIVKGSIYIVRGFILNRNVDLDVIEPHVLIEGIFVPGNKQAERGFNIRAFDYPKRAKIETPDEWRTPVNCH